MSKIEIVPATLEHVQALGQCMNDEDMQEAVAGGLVPRRALWRGWKQSLIRYAALVDGEIAAMWGVSGSIMGGIGVPWLVTARAARKVSPHEFRKIYVNEVRKMLEIYPVLVNYVDARYDGAVRMLKISGFNLDEPAPLGKFRRMFRKFMLEA